ncbi:MAG: FAD-dependent monooxygenase [Deltaproteobacteria bacterium]|nr:FAD-dependent monooxygenase [Deltaproteobacteria bacterium]
MNIACIGGGPAGLYLGILVKRSAPEHDVVVYERNRPADTFGFGVVFSDATLGHLAAADPESHEQITAEFARWDDIEIHVGGEVLRSTGHGFCGLERRKLLEILQTRAKALGVRVEFEREIKSLSEISADVVVACDGVASWVRDTLAPELKPHVEVRSNKFVWLGCTVPYGAFTFIFKETPHGLFRVHAYRYHDEGSTFIVECREDTWRAAGLAEATEDQTVAILERIFAAELAGHHLIKNRSIWRNFPTVRCGKWHAGNVVLVGDAAHTAHFSIGSGTKLAMEDAIALRDELLRSPLAGDIPAALAAYEARRRPEVEALQAAAQASLEWFEGTERYLRMAPVELTYSLMTRSLRVSHASVAKRDPHLARGVEKLLAATVGIAVDPPPPPTALPFALGPHRTPSRIAVAAAPGDEAPVAMGAAAAAGAGLVVTPTLTPQALATDIAAAGWSRMIEDVHSKGALVAVKLGTVGNVGASDAMSAAIQRAGIAGFDLLILDPGEDVTATEALPATLEVARALWRATAGSPAPRWIGAVVHDKPAARAAVVGHTAQLVRAGADIVWVSSRGDGSARLPAAPLADRLRNELRVATCVVGDDALLPDLDAAVAAGRADLVLVDRMPAGARRA